MKFRKLKADFKGEIFVIEESTPIVGAYLYIFKDGYCHHDYLQDDIDMCKRFANKHYGVPLDNWVENEE